MEMRAAAAAMAVAVLAAVAGGDVTADRSECAEQLAGLAPCLAYVEGQAAAPAPDCCSGLRQVLGKSPKCLCVLIKDRDDPNLGIRINASLALALPSACRASHANVSHCPQLLNLPPNSKDAAIFSPGGSGSSAAAPAKGNSSTATAANSRAQPLSSGSSSLSMSRVGSMTVVVGYVLLVLLLLPPFLPFSWF